MNRLAIGIFLTLFFLVLCFFVKVPLQMTANAKVYPFQRWSVKHLDNGNIHTQWYNYLEGNTPTINSFQFERGDIVTTHVSEKRGRVHLGDTLVFIRSFDLEIRLTRLREALRVAKASLQVVATGARNARVLQAQKELSFARQQLERAQQNYDRNKPLFEEDVLPQSDFEQITNQFELAKIQVEIAESQLLAAQTGRKPEEIELARTRIRALTAELEVLEQKKDAYMIKAPFEGELGMGDSLNEIISVENSSQKIIMIPIPMREKVFLGDSVHISYANTFATSMRLPQTVSAHTIGQQQVFFVKFEIPGQLDLSIGQWITCKITGRELNVWEYLKYLFMK